MSDTNPVPNNFILTKQDVINQLKEAFSNGYLVLDDYESRITQAENTSDIQVLRNLITDLPKPVVQEISEFESLNCNMITKNLEGSILQTKKLNIEASMSTIRINYQVQKPINGKQEICVKLNMSNLILYLPDDVIVDNKVQEEMSTYKEIRNRNYNPNTARTVIRITGTAKMSNIKVKRKRYILGSNRKG
jgi:Domain of unknown function (DUF1707).